MRRILPITILAVVAAIGISACSSSSNATANSADTTTSTSSAAADNATASDNTAVTDNTASTDTTAANAAPANAAPADADAGAPPVYPGAVAGTRPKGVAEGAPSTVKAYLTPDGMVTVHTWYKAHLKGAQEISAPDNAKDKDVFLVGQGPTGQVVMLQTVGGKTWVVIGPAK